MNSSYMQGLNIVIDGNSRIKAFDITIQKGRPGKIVVGSKETNSYIIVDEAWNNFIEILDDSLTLSEIAQKLNHLYPKNFEAKRALTRLKMMVIYLIENKLIYKVNGQIIYKSKKQKDVKSFISNSVFWVIAIPVLTFAVLSVFVLTKSFPVPQDFFWSKYLSLCLLSSFIFTWVSALFHEAAHLFIARMNGIKGKLRLSHRLNFLVVETYFPDIYALSKKARIAIYISGIIIDMSIITVLYGLVPLTNHGIVGQLILLEWLSILWQFFFFMKTDVYFVIKEIVGLENLYTYAKMKILNIFKFRRDISFLNKRENRIVNIYAAFFVIGTFIGLFRYGFYHIPILMTLIAGSIGKIASGFINQNGVLFFDGLVVLVIEIILNALLIFTVFRKKVRV